MSQIKDIVGEKKANILAERGYSSTDDIDNATTGELKEIDGIGKTAVQKLKSTAAEKVAESKEKNTENKDDRLKLLEKIENVRNSVDYLQKNNRGDQFSYVSSSQVLAAIRQELKDQKLLLEPVLNKEGANLRYMEEESQSMMVELKYKYRWVDVETGATYEIPWYALGSDYHEKGVGKALTYGEKYFLLKYFNVPTDEADPDKFQEAAERQRNRQQTNSKEFKKKKSIFNKLKKIDEDISRDNIKEKVQDITNLELEPDNFDEINNRLDVKIDELQENSGDNQETENGNS